MALLPRLIVDVQLPKVPSEQALNHTRKTPLRLNEPNETAFRNPLLDPVPRPRFPKLDKLSDSFEKKPRKVPETEPVTPRKHSQERNTKAFKVTRTYQSSEDATLPAVVDVFRVRTRKGMMSGKPKRFNQDVCMVIPDFVCRNQYFFGVFDGHGTYGHEVAAFVKRVLPLYIEHSLPLTCDTQTVKSAFPHFPAPEDQLRLQTCLEQAHRTTADDLALQHVIDVTFSGTTAVSIVLRGRFLTCANVGDSRAIIGRLTPDGWMPIALSTDHKPNDPLEQQRIEASGGRVEPYSGVPPT